MFLVPYKRMVITSSQEDNIIINRLKDIVEPNVYWFKHPSKEKEFVGNISSTSFYMTRNIIGRNNAVIGRIYEYPYLDKVSPPSWLQRGIKVIGKDVRLGRISQNQPCSTGRTTG